MPNNRKPIIVSNSKDATHKVGKVKAMVVSKKQIKYKFGTKTMKYGDGIKKIKKVLSKPTTQDSLDLYNNAIQVEKYYNDKKYKKAEYQSPFYGPNHYLFEKAQKENAEYFKTKKEVLVPSKEGKAIIVPASKIQFRKVKNANQYYQRESESDKLDTRSPMQLYDRRITPQLMTYYDNQIKNDPMEGDGVILYKYDPIAVKPVKLLTAEERKIRAKRYGDISDKKSTKPIIKQPYVYKKPIPDTRDKTIIEPLTPKQAKLNIETPQDTLKPLPITNTVVPEAAPKKLPGGSGKFARYPNMKKQLGNLKTSRMVNAKKVENIVPIFVSGAKSVKQYRGDENLPEAKNGMKNCGCKHPKKKYKYGTGALTIPEGSAIVTAQVDKKTGTIPAKKAIELYKYAKQTNSTKAWKGLNNLIEKMPEDRVDKAQDGRKKLEARYKELGELTGPLSDAQKKELETLKSQLTEDEYDIYTDERIAEKFGQKYDVDKAKWKSSLKGGKLNLKEDANNAKYRESLRDPKVLKAAIASGKVKIDAKGNISYTSIGDSAPGKQEFLGTFKKGALPTLQGSPDLLKGPPPDEGNINKDIFAGDKKKGNFLANIPSLAEVAARASILGQGVEKVPENYLSLGRYKYQSQLPKTLQEISLAEQGGRETARNMVGGDAGRYMSQLGSLSTARIKAANEAVIQDTLARQDILNRNVDLGNTEAQVNTGLKNQFAQQRAANRGAYNNQLIALGQGIDTATDASKLMASQRNVDDIRTNLLKSKDYYMDPQGNIRMGKNGIKKVKTYKRK